ncbi:RNA methyltransferase [Treponema parvum]|uniref:Ribosomal RNA small subunit methyltransferase E n=1 Tax=Treponema parvum TaxID=138851 RepID=A0A975F177_9SPIR|nr:RsmE family RNA methyltransferase [Treponema parvum]QTQ12488.1 RNA methyltransferase [Treponema parvum]
MRQFIASVPIGPNGILRIEGKDYRYFKQVLRVKKGDLVSVRLTDGALQEMKVCGADENKRFIELQACNEGKNITRGIQASLIEDFQAEYWLFQFIARPQKMDIIIRQAAECGVARIIPVIGEYTQKDGTFFNASRQERILRIIKEARQQSGSPVSTVFENPCGLDEAVNLWRQRSAEIKNSAAFFLTEQALDALGMDDAVLGFYERTDRPSIQRSAEGEDRRIRLAGLAVGCEGGISSSEMSFLKENGFIPVHFRTNILRCETAALYGIAVLQNLVTGKN